MFESEEKSRENSFKKNKKLKFVQKLKKFFKTKNI